MIRIGAGLAWVLTLPRATRKYRREIFGLYEGAACATQAATDTVTTPYTNSADVHGDATSTTMK